MTYTKMYDDVANGWQCFKTYFLGLADFSTGYEKIPNLSLILQYPPTKQFVLTSLTNIRLG
jgi:hypothetical protein